MTVLPELSVVVPKPEGKFVVPPTSKVPVLATVFVPVPASVKVLTSRVPFTVKLAIVFVLAASVTVVPLAITTLLPAVGTVPRFQVVPEPQLPLVMEVYVGGMTAGRLMADMAYLMLPLGVMAEVAALSVVFAPGIVRLATSSFQPLPPLDPVLFPPLVQFAFIV